MFAGPAIALPPYDPADGQRGPEAKALVAALRRADGVIVSSPSYHGSVSGLLKNALDYTEDLRGDARVYLSERALGIIVCADGIQAMGSTLNTLRSIAHALRAWPTPFAAVVNSGGEAVRSRWEQPEHRGRAELAARGGAGGGIRSDADRPSIASRASPRSAEPRGRRAPNRPSA